MRRVLYEDLSDRYFGYILGRFRAIPASFSSTFGNEMEKHTMFWDTNLLVGYTAQKSLSLD